MLDKFQIALAPCFSGDSVFYLRWIDPLNFALNEDVLMGACITLPFYFPEGEQLGFMMHKVCELTGVYVLPKHVVTKIETAYYKTLDNQPKN